MTSTLPSPLRTSSHNVLWSSPTLWRPPLDVLLWRFYIARLAMNTVLRIDLELYTQATSPLLPFLAIILYILVHTRGAESVL